MFQRLHQIVKLHASKIIGNNNIIEDQFKESVANDASGTIIDVLKSHIDSGKAKDIYTFLNSQLASNNNLCQIIANKYANRLNKYYHININDAKSIANKLIPEVMNNFATSTKQATKEEEGVFSFLNSLSGYTINFQSLFNKMNYMQIA